MHIFVAIPNRMAEQINATISIWTLGFLKQILNQKGIDTSDVYFEISTKQGIKKYQQQYDNHVLEQLGVVNEMTITMRSNNEQKNQQVNPQPNMQPLDQPQLNVMNQQNAQSINWNNPPPSFQKAQQNQQQQNQQQYQFNNPSTPVKIHSYNRSEQLQNPQQFNNLPKNQFEQNLEQDTSLDSWSKQADQSKKRNKIKKEQQKQYELTNESILSSAQDYSSIHPINSLGNTISNIEIYRVPFESFLDQQEYMDIQSMYSQQSNNQFINDNQVKQPAIPEIQNQQQVIATNEIDELLLQLRQSIMKKQQNDQNHVAQQILMNEELLKQQQLKLHNQQKRQELERSEERRRSQLVESQRLISQMMETHGKIDVCFLVDCTGSMDVYKEQAMKCVEGTLRDIKFKTNRDTLWAAVGYQDFHEYKQLGQYYQTDFNSQTEVVYNFLNGIKCAGGDDATEDIRGGIKQMIRKLNWSHHYKIAVLICDAPNHGKLWNGGCADEYPDEDLTDALQMLIDAKIMLIGIQFTKFTKVMFDRMEQFYTNQNKMNLLFLCQMETIQGSQIHMQLANLISQASVRLTFTNDMSTKLNKDNQQECKGAIEALSNSEMDPFKFDTDPKIEIVQTTFKVYRTELKNQALESTFIIKLENILQIDKISLPDDYDITFEAQWQVKRTQIPYTDGQMKSVYLMRRCDQKEELYVIKMPLNGTTYPTLEKALWECRSHLIAQALMNRFINALKQANQDAKSTIEIPNLSYSNFLILQEQPNKFWIGERFLKGEFVKYNNNYGFIKDTGSILNQLAQAFSYYTLFISGFNYLVCDIQGVGLYLTDPAINTKVGKFDETDMGLFGIAQFNVTFQMKRTLCKRILQLLRLEMI